MFNTIKVKIIALTISVLLILSGMLCFTSILNFNKFKSLMIKSCDFTITTFVEKINKEISKLENNALDLALMGEIYYKTGKSPEIREFIVKRTFQNYKNSLGGGIWFEPYIITPTKRLSCIYAFRDKKNEVITDSNFETEKYDYHNQSWYKEIKPKLINNNLLGWSKPYYDGAGSEALMTTVGAKISSNGKFIGMSTVDWKISSIVETVSKMRPTQNSFVLFADRDNDFVIVYTDRYSSNLVLGSSLNDIPWYKNTLEDKGKFEYKNINYISYVKTLDNGMILIINVPENELLKNVIIRVTVIFILLLMICIIISAMIYSILKRDINKPIDELIEITEKIGQGNLDIEIKIDKPQEFCDLAKTFNKMTTDIKNYIDNLNTITQEKEKIKSELSIAKEIQYSALPSVFYPEIKEFDIYATMNSAKEVGGDFYDFFFINPNRFMFLIADVSGKGVPAALFMMTTKTLIKNIANENYSPKELIEKINNTICENNKQGFFVTMFACIVDTITGNLTYLNCGHNPPLIKRNNQNYEYLNIASNIALGVYPNFEYNIEETKLNDGDIILLYTDGVTEALNENTELYGEERFKISLNSGETKKITDLKDLITSIKCNLDNYTGQTEQSDDITMLAFKFNGVKPILEEKIKLIANKDKFLELNSWLEQYCEKLNIKQQEIMKLMLITEEVFVNIASYAYTESNGEVEILLQKNENEIILTFSDNGVQYNPLDKKDPNIELSAKDRPIGGLGIYMIKNVADYLDYEYKDNKNILKVKLVYK